MLKKFLSYYGPHKLLFSLDMGASLLVALSGIVYPVVTRTMLNDLIPNRQYRMIVIYGLTLLVIYLVRMWLNFFIQYKGHMMGTQMQAAMRSDLFTHLEKLPFSFFDQHETGKIMSRMTTDLFDITELAHHGPENLIIASISVVVSFAYLMSINVMLSIIVFLVVPFLIGISNYMRTRMRSAFTRSRQATAVINASLENSISGIRVTKAFTNAAKETEKFEHGNTLFKEASRDAYKAMGQFHSGTTFITDIFNVVILIAGGLFLYDGKITFADYSAFIVSINLFLGPVNTLIRFMEQYQSGVAGFERFVEVLDMKPEMDRDGAKNVPRLQGEIEFDDVTFAYDGEHDVLKNIDMKIKPGQTFALVGPSGGGKTTICHLIPHFYQVEKGRILLDGMDIRDITLESLRRNIGIVQQDIYLFNASIRDNILYGRLDATEEEVVEAAKRANIHDYIMTLDEGYDTVIGERGVRLSGGQKQRLCIARVFLKNPPMLILDEATSALDNTTEIMIQQALDELCKGRTTLVVAHRLSTIKNADAIAVISEGRILEQGTHDELLQTGGLYSQLYHQQFREKN
ncbi:MAG: ABC transporter ATP-binding protein/permease [Lentisphaeria bacterium]|nr:ABC transporter ATP-binding protein/permease [Lentisphaeria bacterium]